MGKNKIISHDPRINPTFEMYGQKYKVLKHTMQDRTFYTVGQSYMTKRFYWFGKEVERFQILSQYCYDYKEAIRFSSIQEVKEYIDRWYKPENNMTIELTPEDISWEEVK